MKNFRSEYAFQKHKPYLSLHKKILFFFRKKRRVITQPQNSFHYKTNPFRTSKKNNQTNLKIIVLSISLIAWAICLAYIPYFKINKINYSGLNNNTKEELDIFIYENFINKKSFLPLSNYFFVNKDKISKDLYQKFALETVEVTKIFPNQLEVNIKEKISSVIYDNGKKYFLLDNNGTVTKYLKDVETYEITQTIITSSVYILSATSTASSSIFLTTSTIKHTPDYKKINKMFGDYPIIYDRRALDVEIKQRDILPSEHISTVIEWYKGFPKQGVGQLKFFVLDNIYSGIAMETTNRWIVLFEPTNNTETEINNLKEILSHFKPQQYIDLRYGEKVYWK